MLQISQMHSVVDSTIYYSQPENFVLQVVDLYASDFHYNLIVNCKKFSPSVKIEQIGYFSSK